MTNLSSEEILKNTNFRQIVDWRVKNDFLKNQISALEKLKDYPIFSISVFLLKTQLIEFELKQLITSLDLHLSFSNSSRAITRRARTPQYLDEKKVTLGVLKREISQFKGDPLKDLNISLANLVGLRIKFVHHLFNPGSINELITDTEKGLKISNQVLTDIESLNKFLNENDPLNTKK